jgi:hypothetical protein
LEHPSFTELLQDSRIEGTKTGHAVLVPSALSMLPVEVIQLPFIGKSLLNVIPLELFKHLRDGKLRLLLLPLIVRGIVDDVLRIVGCGLVHDVLLSRQFMVLSGSFLMVPLGTIVTICGHLGAQIASDAALGA